MSALEDLMKGRSAGTPAADPPPLFAPPATPKEPAKRTLITKPGIYEISEEDYHADPCETPSLSASIAKKLVAHSPAHAWHSHPRLNPNFTREEKEIFDRGTVAHALLLQGLEIAVVLDFDDWRTKDAKTHRDMARAADKIPILRKHWDSARAMVDRCREQLAQHKEASDAFTAGKPEQALVWREDNGVWCRARLDWLHDSFLKIDDYKSSGRDVDTDSLTRHCVDDWEIQDAWYRRGVKKVTGQDAQFRFVAQENNEPFAVNVVGLGPDFQWMGDAKVEYAIRVFGKCLKSNRWPGYPNHIDCVAKIPKWAEDSWLAKEQGR